MRSGSKVDMLIAKKLDKSKIFTVVSGMVNPPLQQSYKSSQFVSVKTTGYAGFVGYNEANHSLDWFQMSGKEVQLRQITKLELEGSEKIEVVRAFYVHTPDSIFIKSRNFVYIVNQKGSAFYKVNTATEANNSISGINLDQYQPTANQKEGRGMYFKSGKLYMPLNYYVVKEWIDPAGFASDVVLLSAFDVENKQFKQLPIFYPEIFRSNLYGFLSKMTVNYGGDNIYYSFVGFPELYIYNIVTEKNRMLQSMSFGMPDIIKGEELGDHLNQNIRFDYSFSSEDGSFVAQYVFYPFDPANPKSPDLRVINVNAGEETLIELPKRTNVYGALIDGNELYLPRVSETEDLLELYKLAL